MSDETNSHDPLADWQRAMAQGMAAWQTMAAPQAAAATQIFQQAMAQGLTTWTHLGQQTQGPSDALADWKKCMDQAVELLAKSLAETMASEQFAAVMGQALQQYLTAVGPARQHIQTASEEMLRTFNLPSRTQITRLAANVVGVDERVESVDDRLEALQEQLQAMAAQLAALQVQIKDHDDRATAGRPAETPEAPPTDADRSRSAPPKRRPPKEGQA
jgi:hypothetical protein